MNKKKVKKVLRRPMNYINRVYTKFIFFKNSKKPIYDIDHLMGLNDKVIVFAPHVDDETIGLGGTLLKYKEKGEEIYVVYMTDGSGATTDLDEEELIKQRKNEAENLKEIYNIKEIFFLDYKDSALDYNDENLIDNIKLIVKDIKPTIIYIPFLIDSHVDHFNTSISVLNALYDMDNEYVSNLKIICYQINSPIMPNLITNITALTKEQFEKKKKIYRVFSSQWAMGFDVFSLIDERQTSYYKKGVASEVFVKSDLKSLIKASKYLIENGYNPTDYVQLSSEFNLIKAFRHNRDKKKEFSDKIAEILFGEEGGSIDRAI
ncbi:MAG: PIG-L family deacetylase [Tissierellales bacterium]|nr:PIG-L family deacetylase [Tissierellales bacterium]